MRGNQVSHHIPMSLFLSGQMKSLTRNVGKLDNFKLCVATLVTTFVHTCFYGACNYSGLVRQVSGFSNGSVSA